MNEKNDIISQGKKYEFLWYVYVYVPCQYLALYTSLTDPGNPGIKTTHIETKWS